VPILGTGEVGMPFGKYKSFADCVRKNKDKKDPDAYCGKIKHQVEGKKSRKPKKKKR
jgi:hypothetical protein